jgi:hypothetical protein
LQMVLLAAQNRLILVVVAARLQGTAATTITTTSPRSIDNVVALRKSVVLGHKKFNSNA